MTIENDIREKLGMNGHHDKRQSIITIEETRSLDCGSYVVIFIGCFAGSFFARLLFDLLFQSVSK